MIAVDSTIRRPSSFPYCGRLIALPTSQSLEVGRSLDLENQVSIDFPAMPDTVKLARGTDYSVITNMMIPDGVHLYKGTRPLEIPFSFKLHAFDKAFCPNGAYTLLQIASRLHSFVLPVDTSGGTSTIFAKAPAPTEGTDAAQEAAAAAPDGGVNYDQIARQAIFAPVTVRLELIFTDQDSPGISCVGYVREVVADLNGPWLRGPGRSSNLPTSGDFSFVFVHRPGHGNMVNSETTNFDLQPQAYADTVNEKLYNTRSLVTVANYQGLKAQGKTVGSRIPTTSR